MRHDAAHPPRVLRAIEGSVELQIGACRSEVDPDPARGGGGERRLAHQGMPGAEPLLARDVQDPHPLLCGRFAFAERALRRRARDGVVGFGKVVVRLSECPRRAEQRNQQDESRHARALHHATDAPATRNFNRWRTACVCP